MDVMEVFQVGEDGVAGLYKNLDRAKQSRRKILWPQTLLPEDAASWGGLNKQTFYILSYQTYLNMDVFQIVFSVFCLIRVSAYSCYWICLQSWL